VTAVVGGWRRGERVWLHGHRVRWLERSVSR